MAVPLELSVSMTLYLMWLQFWYHVEQERSRSAVGQTYAVHKPRVVKATDDDAPEFDPRPRNEPGMEILKKTVICQIMV